MYQKKWNIKVGVIIWKEHFFLKKSFRETVFFLKTDLMYLIFTFEFASLFMWNKIILHSNKVYMETTYDTELEACYFKQKFIKEIIFNLIT